MNRDLIGALVGWGCIALFFAALIATYCRA
jgi:hypothetical protein